MMAERSAIDRHSWNEQVKPYWDDYEDALDDYNDYEVVVLILISMRYCSS